MIIIIFTMYVRIITAFMTLLFIGVNPLFALFSDIEYSWYESSINTLAGEKIISGFDDGTFGPEKSITRAEILKIILQASGNGVGEVPLDRCFPDVAVNMWYHAYICRAYSLRVTSGFSDGTFKPNNTVTTLEALAFGTRAFGLSIPKTGSGELWYEPLGKFADEKHILPMSSYTLATPISRGKATELILRIRSYKQSQAVLSYGSSGCKVGRDLQTKNTIMIAWKSREYLLSIPTNYTKNKQYSLIVASHGRTNSNAEVRDYMGLEWSRRGWVQTDFIIAYPAGIDVASGGRSWSEAESITFFDAMIEQIGEAYCVNRSEIYLVGHSLGGWFTHKLACLRGEIVRGMAGVGSAGYSGNCTGPVASLLYQNVDDKLSPYSSWVSGREIRKKVNLCSNETTQVKIGSLTCQKSEKCSSNSPVIWCEGYSGLWGDPHSWPIGAGDQILGFLRGM